MGRGGRWGHRGCGRLRRRGQPPRGLQGGGTLAGPPGEECAWPTSEGASGVPADRRAGRLGPSEPRVNWKEMRSGRSHRGLWVIVRALGLHPAPARTSAGRDLRREGCAVTSAFSVTRGTVWGECQNKVPPARSFNETFAPSQGAGGQRSAARRWWRQGHTREGPVPGLSPSSWHHDATVSRHPPPVRVYLHVQMSAF